MRATYIAIALFIAAAGLISAGIIDDGTVVIKCTMNGAPAGCGPNPVLALGIGPSKYGSGDGFGIGLSLNASAGVDPESGIFSTSGFISWTLEATTPGPVRPGVLFYSVAADGDSGGGGGSSSQASISGLASCMGPGFCFQKGTDGVHVPLGVPFEVTLYAAASGVGEIGFGGGGWSTADVVMNFFDLSGARVPIVPATTTPEPSHLSYLGILLLVPAIVKKRTGPPRPTWPH
jgi:hypothetical protein